MKKLLGIVVLGLLISNIAYALKLELRCGEKTDMLLYIRIDDEIIHIFEPNTNNKIRFKVKAINDYGIISHGRRLDKATTSHDTHLTTWTGWEEDDKYIRDHMHSVAIDRTEGKFIFGRSTEPWAGEKNYDYKPVWEVPCRKLEKKF